MKLNKVIAILAVTVVAVGAMAQGGGGGGGNRGGGGGRGQRMGFGGMAMDPAMLLLGGGGGGRGFGGGGAGGGNLREDIETDLKVTDDQKTKLSAIGDKQRERMREMFTRNAGGGGGNGGGGRGFQLSDEQRKELEKAQAETAKEINAILTPDQQKRIKQIGVQIAGNRAVANPDTAKELGLSEEQKTKVADLQKKAQDANMALFQNQDLEMQERMERVQNNNKVLDEELGKVLTEAQKTKLKEMAGPAFKRSDT